MIEDTEAPAPPSQEPTPELPSDPPAPPFHPMLFALFPVLSLFSANITEVTWGQIVLPIGIAVGSASGLLVLLRLFLRSFQRAGVVVSGIVFLFFFYGTVADFLDDHHVVGADLGRPRVLLPLWGAIILVIVFLAVRARRLGNLTKILNVVAVVLVLTALIPIVSHELGERHGGSSAAGHVSPTSGTRAGATIQKRDIYYIMIEDEGASSTLKKLWNFDDHEFYDGLRSLGFYVADEARANYPNTTLSLASSLNAQYLDELLTKPTGGLGSSWRPADSIIKGPFIARYLRGQGYKYVHIGGWWDPTRKDPTADKNFVFDPLSEFSRTLLQQTAAWPIVRQLGIGKKTIDERAAQFARVPYQVKQTIAARSLYRQPTFTFTHILVPHEPYVFAKDGHFVTAAQIKAEGNLKGYLDQIVYLHTVLLDLLKQLLSGPESERPVVVLQSDEGPQPSLVGDRKEHFKWSTASLLDMQTKFPIVSAYYLPGVEKTGLYRTISPVNSFRLIFNDYLGADFPLLADRSYVFPDYSHVYTFVDVTDRVRD